MRRMKSGQLLFVFADSSKESEERLAFGVPKGKSFLLHIAKARKAMISSPQQTPP